MSNEQSPEDWLLEQIEDVETANIYMRRVDAWREPDSSTPDITGHRITMDGVYVGTVHHQSVVGQSVQATLEMRPEPQTPEEWDTPSLCINSDDETWKRNQRRLTPEERGAVERIKTDWGVEGDTLVFGEAHPVAGHGLNDLLAIIDRLTGRG